MIRSIASTLLGTAVAAVVIAGCAGPDSSAASGSSPASVPPATDPAPTASAPPASQAAASPTPADGGVFFLCPTTTDADACPLTPGALRADLHDAFELVVSDEGWQEERAPASEEPSVVLSRIEAPEQRLTIDIGSTGALLDDAALLALLAGAAPLQTGEPVAASVGNATGYQVELAPTAAAEFAVPGAGPIVVEPGHRYRLFALQRPMDQESGIKVILIDAPTDEFATFETTAAGLLDTLTFD